MSMNKDRVFSAERRVRERNPDGSMADVLAKMASLENNLRAEFTVQFKNLCDRLDVIVEDEEQTTTAEDIMAEIMAMNEHISVTKQEVAALKPVDEANTTISVATEELSQVVQSTEIAANTILENAEHIDTVVTALREKITEGDPDGLTPDLEKLDLIGMELMTACSFQDITGQRITKVVNSLNYIEERLEKMIDIWQIEHGTADVQEISLPKGDTRDDKDLIHGPQSEAGMGQADIDALFD